MLTFKTYITEKRKVNSSEIFNVLQHGDIKKNPSRVTLFLAKIKDGEEFLTAKKGMVTIDKSEYDDFKEGFKRNGFSKMVKTSKGTIQYPKGFLKSGEFGGKGKGFGTRAEDAALTNVQKELQKVLAKEEQPFIKLKIGAKTVECAAIVTTDGSGGRAPKSDFTVKDTKGNEVAHISHKKGSKASDFQQYGGITVIPDNAEIESFVKRLIELNPDGLKSGQNFYRKIKSKDLILKSIYGVNYKLKTVDKNSVDEFHQGDMTFKKVGTTYQLQSTHKGKNGDLPEAGSGYEAVLHARYQGPNARYGNLTIDHCRILVYPMGSIAKTAKEI